MGQVCFAYTLDHDRRITFSCWFLFLQVGVPCRVLLRTPCFPMVVHHRLPLLLFSSLCGFFLLCRLLSLGILSLLRSVVPLATGSSSCLTSLFSLAASSLSHSLSLPLVSHSSSLQDSESGILMRSGLLVWQIPYREMRSLGLKVSICRGSPLPCLVLCGSLGARRDLQLVRAVPDSTEGISWT